MHKEMQRPALLPSNRVKEVEGHIQLITDRIVNEFLSEENKPINILPKKTNADLKRFLHKRFEKLNRRTEIAIVELLSILSSYFVTLLGEKMMGLRVEEPIRKVEPTPSRPARDLSKGAAPSYNRYERDEDNDYEEDRDDTLGANLLEGMRVQDKMMQVCY